MSPHHEDTGSSKRASAQPQQAQRAVASAGVAGSYTDPAGSNRTVRINAKGLELNQAFLKSKKEK